MSHPVALPFRILPNMRAFLRFCLDERLDNTAKIANVRMPTLILHGKNDRLITVDQGRCLYRCAKSAGVDVRFVEFDNCGHNNVNSAPEYLPEVYKFVQTHRHHDIIQF